MKTEARKLSQHKWHGKRYVEFRTMIDAIKLKYGCVDCGYKERSEALQFDHIDPKTKNFKIGAACSRNFETILEEIAKCVIRCANCHAIKTAASKISRIGFKPFVE